MIIIKDLTKQYKSKNSRKCTALDKVNLILPNTGMVFIVGKSGSGKSTLLNMIGGLDNFDSGEIIAGGNNLATFKSSDFYRYRASYVGFIFQDYHLLEELTVEDNIKLEAEIANEEEIDLIQALKSVDLEGYERRFPDELSGGQKQRVAIARALIKKPSIILCDEPTGNLDANTSTQIMDLLKEISKEKLVLIVSHNMLDAQKYADRIVELSDGKIYRDTTRRKGYKNDFAIEEETIVLPYNHNLTKNETQSVETAFLTGKAKHIIQNDSGYEETQIEEKEEFAPQLKKSKMKGKTTLKLFSAFTRASKTRMIISAFLSAMMIVLLIIFQSFLCFDNDKAIIQAMGGDQSKTLVSLMKNNYIDEYGNVTSSSLYTVTDDDLEKIDELGGEGTRKYLLYSYALPVNLQNRPQYVEREKAFVFNFGKKHIYSPQMPGTLACDVDYLTRKFGKDGKINVLAGKLEDSYSSAGIIITDYLADAMLMYNPKEYKTYNDIITSLYVDRYKWGDVVAIIDTGYKEKYADLIEQVKNNAQSDKVGLELIDKEKAENLIDDIKVNLSIGYSINPNFYNECIKEGNKNYIRIVNSQVTVGEQTKEIEHEVCVGKEYFNNTKIKDGEIYLSSNLIKNFFPSGKVTFPFKIEIVKYEYPNNKGRKVYQKTFTVIGEKEQTTLSTNDIEEYRKVGVSPYAVYIENTNNYGEIINGMATDYFTWNSTEGKAITLLNKSVDMFFDLFKFLEVLILVMAVVFLVSYSIRCIRNNYYQIGVIKAIGGNNKDISKIFILQNVLVSAIVVVLTFIGSAIFIEVANEILTASFTAMTGVGIGNITIISFDIGIVLVSLLATIVLGLISTIIPLLLLSKIKPMNIIKAKE